MWRRCYGGLGSWPRRLNRWWVEQQRAGLVRWPAAVSGAVAMAGLGLSAAEGKKGAEECGGYRELERGAMAMALYRHGT